MGGKEEEEAGDVAVKMPEATLKIFNGVQVGIQRSCFPFCPSAVSSDKLGYVTARSLEYMSRLF